jgi:hypothetical protein
MIGCSHRWTERLVAWLGGRGIRAERCRGCGAVRLRARSRRWTPWANMGGKA